MTATLDHQPAPNAATDAVSAAAGPPAGPRPGAAPGRDPDRAGPRQWAGLAVLALPTLLVSIDVFVMLLALPHIGVALGASRAEQLWITDAYGFVLSGALITMGVLGDRFGRRRLLLGGAALFGVASVIAAYSTSPAMLIAARGLLGIAGATLAPAALAIITTMFRDAAQRATAIGLWLVCFMGGAAIGPVVGGLLLERFWWGAAFLIGAPAMVLLLVLGPIVLPDDRRVARTTEDADTADAAGNVDAGSHGPSRIDLVSVVLSFAAVLPFVYGVKELATQGLHASSLLAVAAGLGLAIVFVRRQRALAEPLLDLRLFSNHTFSAALGGMFASTLLMGSSMLFITQQLQLVAGLSPFQAGLWMLPAAVASVISFQVSPSLARRFRAGRLIGGGLLISVTGLLVLTQVSDGPLLIAVAYVITSLGAGPLVMVGTHLVMSSAPAERAGAASALNETSGEFGYALGVATVGSLGAAVYRASVDGTSAAGTDSAAGLAGDALAAAQAAATTSLHVVAGISAAVLLVVAFFAVRLLGDVPPIATDEPGPADDAGTAGGRPVEAAAA